MKDPSKLPTSRSLHDQVQAIKSESDLRQLVLTLAADKLLDIQIPPSLRSPIDEYTGTALREDIKPSDLIPHFNPLALHDNVGDLAELYAVLARSRDEALELEAQIFLEAIADALEAVGTTDANNLNRLDIDAKIQVAQYDTKPSKGAIKALMNLQERSKSAATLRLAYRSAKGHSLNLTERAESARGRYVNAMPAPRLATSRAKFSVSQVTTADVDQKVQHRAAHRAWMPAGLDFQDNPSSTSIPSSVMPDATPAYVASNAADSTEVAVSVTTRHGTAHNDSRHIRRTTIRRV